jgi:hypothetical protein
MKHAPALKRWAQGTQPADAGSPDGKQMHSFISICGLPVECINVH